MNQERPVLRPCRQKPEWTADRRMPPLEFIGPAMDTSEPSPPVPQGRDDTGEIIRFMVIKAAIFILLPAVIAAVAVIVLM